MSFPRAKRFNYKNPDDNISPADFNMTSSLNKGYQFPKCPRFRQKQSNDDDMSTSVCSRSNCCRDIPLHCSTPHKRKNRPIKSHSKEKVMEDFMGTNPNRGALSKAKPQKKTEQKYVQNIVSKFEKNENVNFLDAEQFIDDDYHSYTSSEEFESLKKIEDFEFEEVCRALKTLQDNTMNEKPIKNAENLILEKIENIEKNLERFQSDFNRLNEIMHTERLNKRQEKEMAKIDNVRSYFDCHQSSLSQDGYNAIKEIIKKAIAKLRNDFEVKRKAILVDNENKIAQLINEMHTFSNRAGQQTKRLCENTASDLIEKLVDVLNNHSSSNAPTSDFDTSKHFEAIVQEVEEDSRNGHDCFNYENICKVLSDHLQDSKDELAALEQDKMDITMKYGDTQQALEEQASVITMLYSEIAAIRRDFAEDS